MMLLEDDDLLSELRLSGPIYHTAKLGLLLDDAVLRLNPNSWDFSVLLCLSLSGLNGQS
jgi:hypothetical protein